MIARVLVYASSKALSLRLNCAGKRRDVRHSVIKRRFFLGKILRIELLIKLPSKFQGQVIQSFASCFKHFTKATHRVTIRVTPDRVSRLEAALMQALGLVGGFFRCHGGSVYDLEKRNYIPTRDRMRLKSNYDAAVRRNGEARALKKAVVDEG